MKALVVASLLATGCGPHADQRVASVYDLDGKLARLTLDSDADGKPDMVASMDGAAVRVVELDDDGDGSFDRSEFYDGSGTLSRVELVTRRGPVIVRREVFEDGALTRAEEDRDGDGRPDRWETYAGGGLKTLELDSTGAGRPDRRLRYDGDQVLVEALNQAPAPPH